MDRADVVRALKCCIDRDDPCAEDCPMKDAEWKETGLAACRDFADDHVEVPLALIERTVELLKAQEPVKPILDIDEWKCGNCGHSLEHQQLLGDNVLFHEQYRFCPECGQAVKLE